MDRLLENASDAEN